MVKPALEFLRDFLSQNTIDTIITTGPPHSTHLIGLRLRKELNIPWIADFRDPWTAIHYHRSLHLTRSSAKKHKALEREVLNTADAIVVTSPNTKKEFAAITQKPISVITNGYDVPELLSETTTAGEEIRRIPDPKFTIVHIGSLLSNRNPVFLWKVLSELIDSYPKFADKCLIKLVGATSKEVIMSLFEFGLEHHFDDSGYVSHSEAMQLQRNAQVLLLVEMDRSETKAIIPGKLFEYLYAGRPIIALGPEGSDIEGIINETRSGRFFNYSEKEQLKEQLLQYFDAYLNDNLNVDSENIKKYSRRELTKKMAEIVINI
jgi:glycosyltransferase involved in cell wall biosynthesis